METKRVQIPNIGCNGCVNTIKGELSEMSGVRTVEGEVASKTVTVAYEAPATWDSILAKLVEIDYAPAEA